jgi:flagellar hook assembly protein FlgD
MKNYRSTKLIAWLLSMIMILNIFPVSALASVRDDTDMPGVVVYDLKDGTDVTTTVEDDKITLAASGSGLPTNADTSVMVYTLPEGTYPSAFSGRDSDVEWSFDSNTRQVKISWLNEAKASFNAEIPILGENNFVSRHIVYDNEGNVLTEKDIIENTYGQSTFGANPIYESSINDVSINGYMKSPSSYTTISLPEREITFKYYPSYEGEYTVRYIISGESVYDGVYRAKDPVAVDTEHYLPYGSTTEKDKDFVIWEKKNLTGNPLQYTINEKFDSETYNSQPETGKSKWDPISKTISFILTSHTGQFTLHYRVHTADNKTIHPNSNNNVPTIPNIPGAEMSGDATIKKFEGKYLLRAISITVPQTWYKLSDGYYLGYSKLPSDPEQVGHYTPEHSRNESIEWENNLERIYLIYDPGTDAPDEEPNEGSSTPTAETYTITFLDEDGTSVLDTLEGKAYGDTVTYSGQTPTKEGNIQYNYTFAGWQDSDGTTTYANDELPNVTGNATYKATYSQNVNQYTIKFVNYNGTTLQSENLNFGAIPQYKGTTPQRPATAQNSYTFKDWDKKILPVTADATYTATYDSEENKYTITWKDGNGNVLKTDTLEYGATPAYTGATPTKIATAQYTYTFNNTWSPAIESVTGDAEYTAQFGNTVNKYTITWKDGNGDVLKTDTLE